MPGARLQSSALECVFAPRLSVGTLQGVTQVVGRLRHCGNLALQLPRGSSRRHSAQMHLCFAPGIRPAMGPSPIFTILREGICCLLLCEEDRYVCVCARQLQERPALSVRLGWWRGPCMFGRSD